MRIAMVGLCLALASPVFAADLSEKEEKPPTAGKCAAIAFGPRDKWGAESFKDTCEGAASAARAYCEKNMREQGIQGQCRKVKTSTAWVVGVACHTPGGSEVQGLGAGATPVEAISAAIKNAGDAPGKRCGTTIIRSANHKWREFYSTTWTVQLSCGKAIVASSELKGFTPLTRALLKCENTRLSSISVVSAEFSK